MQSNKNVHLTAIAVKMVQIWQEAPVCRDLPATAQNLVGISA
jgi:hypothetical protein